MPAYIIKTLESLGYELKSSDLHSDVYSYFNLLLINPPSFFSLEDLSLIEALRNSKISEKDPERLLDKLTEFFIDENEEGAVLKLYYKNIILLKNSYNTYETNIIDEFASFRCLGGYKFSFNDQFFDPQTTYLIIKLISMCNK